MDEKDSTNCSQSIFDSTKILKLIIYALIFGQQKNLSDSASINSTVAERSEFLKREDVAQSSQNVLKDVSQRKNLPGCGGSFIVQPGDYSFRIFSPDYPLPYPSSLDCVYNVIFTFGLFPCYVDLSFEDFFLDSLPPNCYGDRLEIGYQRFCGGKSGSERFETEWGPDGRKRFTLRFLSDVSETGRGFRICITPAPCIGQQQPYNPYPPNNSPPYYPNPPPVLPPPSLPPQYPYPPNYPTERPPWYPPANPPYIPTDPIPPFLYPPPSPTQWNPPLQSCCGTQYQGRNIYLTSPGFPYQFPNEIDCGYLINRISPYVTHLRITFKYFFLPCPYAPLDAQIGVYRRNAMGYLSINGRHFCGCQTGLSVLVPFDRYERRKFLRLFVPSLYGQSRSSASNGKVLQLNAFNDSTADSSASGKENPNFKPSPVDVFISNARESVQNMRGDQTETSEKSLNRSSPVYFPSADPRQAQDSGALPNPRARNHNLPNFRFYRQSNSTTSSSRKEDKTFLSSSYNRPNALPAIGFLLAISQVEFPYPPVKRKGKDLTEVAETIMFDAKSDNISLPDAQRASSRTLNLPVQSCSINDLPWVRAWLWGLRRKNLLQECPLIPSRPPPPPPPPPSNCGPFYPIQVPEPYSSSSKCCS